MEDEGAETHFDPSLHFIPLDKAGRLPLTWPGEDAGGQSLGGMLAITTDGRISTFPTLWKMVLIGGQHKGYINDTEQGISACIKAQFPNGKDYSGNRIKQYVFGCVMYRSQDGGQSEVISKVFGLTDSSEELDAVYRALQSLGGTTIGDNKWRSVQSNLSSEPMKGWINKFILALKGQGWTDYVKAQLDQG